MEFSGEPPILQLFQVSALIAIASASRGENKNHLLTKQFSKRGLLLPKTVSRINFQPDEIFSPAELLSSQTMSPS